MGMTYLWWPICGDLAICGDLFDSDFNKYGDVFAKEEKMSKFSCVHQ